MAKRAKGSPRVGRAISYSQSNWPEGTPAKRPYPYGSREGKLGLGPRSGLRKRRDEIPPLHGTNEEDTSPPEGFKKGGSVKGHGSGLARRKRR